MVQHYISPVWVYKHPFEMVVEAYEKRFPSCKLIPQFLGSEKISERDNGVIQIVERKCFLNVEAPYLLKKLAGTEHVVFYQKNTHNRKMRKLIIEAKNETFANRILVKELCTYSVHQENSNWTCFEQEASLDVKSFFGFEGTVEKLAMRQYANNIKLGKEVIEYYIKDLHDAGVIHIPTWPETQAAKDHHIEVSLTNQRLRAIDRRVNQHSLPINQSQSFSIEAISPTRKFRIESSKGHSIRGHHITSGGTIISTSSAATANYQDSSSKLEAGYIHRYLGNLSPFEESRLLQLRRWIQETHKGKMPKDCHILRFLKARGYNLEKGREMICHSLAWRKQNSVDKLLATYQSTTTLNEYFAGGWHHRDKDGRPLYVLRLGQMDTKGLLKSIGFDDMQKHILVAIEEGLKLCEEATEKLGRPISNFTLLVDLEGLNMRHLWRPGIKFLLKIIELVEINYPETMGHLIFVRAPRVFPILWTIISPFIDEKTREKFVIFANRDSASGGVTSYVLPEFLPNFLGGLCRCTVPEGGMVPKSLYLFNSSEDYLRSLSSLMVPHSQFSNMEGIYKTVLVLKDFQHEVLINVEDKGSVITWDFDVLKGDVTFTLMRCRRSVTSSPHEHHVSGAVGGIGSIQYTSKDWLLGVDMMEVEPPLVCRDGDGMQGSHVTSQSGSYILQWKYLDSGKSSFDLLSTSRSKVMYHTQLLSSESFRGSISSLRSDSNLSQDLAGSSFKNTS